MEADRIVHVITGLAEGGAEAVLYRLCTHDVPTRHVVVSLMDEGKYGPRLRAAGVTVYCLQMPRGRVTGRGLRQLWRIIREECPSVVQTWMYHADLLGGLVARLAGVSRICWGVHNSELAPGKSRRSTIWIARVNALLSRWVPESIVCCARRAQVTHERLGYKPKHWALIPNGYEVEVFRPDSWVRGRLRTQLGIPDDLPLLGTVARFDPQKDHATLLHALGLLARQGIRFHCVLVGRDMEPTNRVLRAGLAREGLEDVVQLLGQRDDIPALMTALDVHVLSSAYGEAFPNVLAEAMACGTPCVATDVGDAAQIIGETGWVVPPSDATALAQGIAAALALRCNEPERWEGLQRAARRRIVEHFEVGRMVQRYRAVWEGRDFVRGDTQDAS